MVPPSQNNQFQWPTVKFIGKNVFVGDEIISCQNTIRDVSISTTELPFFRFKGKLVDHFSSQSVLRFDSISNLGLVALSHFHTLDYVASTFVHTCCCLPQCFHSTEIVGKGFSMDFTLSVSYLSILRTSCSSFLYARMSIPPQSRVLHSIDNANVSFPYLHLKVDENNPFPLGESHLCTKVHAWLSLFLFPSHPRIPIVPEFLLYRPTILKP